MKPMRSKHGRLFTLGPIARPREGEVVVFSFAEWNWIKAQKLSSEKFDEILRARYQSHHSQVIPEVHRQEQRAMAQHYCANILQILKKPGRTG